MPQSQEAKPQKTPKQAVKPESVKPLALKIERPTRTRPVVLPQVGISEEEYERLTHLHNIGMGTDDDEDAYQDMRRMILPYS